MPSRISGTQIQAVAVWIKFKDTALAWSGFALLGLIAYSLLATIWHHRAGPQLFPKHCEPDGTRISQPEPIDLSDPLFSKSDGPATITRREIQDRMRGREVDWSNYEPNVTLEECEMDKPCPGSPKDISCKILRDYLLRDQ